MKICYVTGNNGKFQEVRDFLAYEHSPVELEQQPFPMFEIQSMDQKAVALDKARQAYAVLKRPLIVDDAAIYFNKYNQFPGVFTRYVYMGIGMDGIFKLVKPGDRAYFLLHLVYIDAQGQEQVFEGRCDGTIVHPAVFKAHPDLPFDDIFLPDGSDLSYAELFGTPAFAQFAYRLKAIRTFLAACL
jgi:non-canonical purine NTP pyrophosphatase (RdgB/HAM1 family)